MSNVIVEASFATEQSGIPRLPYNFLDKQISCGETNPPAHGNTIRCAAQLNVDHGRFKMIETPRKG